MGKIFLGPVIIAFFVFISGCQKSSDRKDTPSANSNKIRIGLVLDKGGKDDKSFNAAAFKGSSEAARDFGIELKVIESPDDLSYEPAIRNLSEKGYNLVITIGFSQADALKKMAPKFPGTHFAIVDALVDTPNVASLMFSEHEGSFLVGYIAGLKSKTKTVGFIGGMEVDLIRRFELGYREGVEYADPKAKVIVNYTGVTSEAWNNPAKGKELALSQISKGADVVFAAAGGTNFGVFDAIEEKKKFGIGVDSNQNWIKPGFILTSMLKRVDTAIYNVMKAEVENKFVFGPKYFGLADKGVDFAVDKHNESLMTPDLLKKIELVRNDMLAGKINVSDYYQTKVLCPTTPFKCDRSPRRMEKSTRTAE